MGILSGIVRISTPVDGDDLPSLEVHADFSG
jgi:hypothetical protein